MPEQAELSLAEVQLGDTPQRVRLELYADIKGERIESGLGTLEVRAPLVLPVLACIQVLLDLACIRVDIQQENKLARRSISQLLCWCCDALLSSSKEAVCLSTQLVRRMRGITFGDVQCPALSGRLMGAVLFLIAL